MLAKQSIEATVAAMPSIKPIGSELIIDLSKKFSTIVVCEEHQVTGGLFSAVAEVVVQNKPVRLLPIGVYDQFGQSGTPDQLIEGYELSARHIAEKAKALLQQ